MLNLSIGDTINLSQRIHEVSHLIISVDLICNEPFNFDTSAFMLGENGKILSDDYFVFYNNTKSPDNAVINEFYYDEISRYEEYFDDIGGYAPMTIQLLNINPLIKHIIFAFTLDETYNTSWDLSLISNMKVNIYETKTKEKIIQYGINKSILAGNALIYGCLNRVGQNWFYQAVGENSFMGLLGLIKQYY